jgi:hypothetical protein
MRRAERLGIRWTIGNVSDRGFAALGLSIWGAWNLFGPSARYAVCANTVPARTVRSRVGSVPDAVEWLDATAQLPRWLRRHLDYGLADGVGCKFAPLQLFHDRKELSLDNDCILWGMPAALEAWLDDPGAGVLLAEDVKAGFGRFSEVCGPEPRNLGMRGIPPGLDLEAALATVLRDLPVILTSELDEQGLQVAALTRGRRAHVVSLEDVTIASPFPPQLPYLGRRGAHFCGLNARRLGWSVDGRPAELLVEEFWQRQLPEVRERVGGPSPDAAGAAGAEA